MPASSGVRSPREAAVAASGAPRELQDGGKEAHQGRCTRRHQGAPGQPGALGTPRRRVVPLQSLGQVTWRPCRQHNCAYRRHWGERTHEARGVGIHSIGGVGRTRQGGRGHHRGVLVPFCTASPPSSAPGLAWHHLANTARPCLHSSHTTLPLNVSTLPLPPPGCAPGPV